MKKIWASIWMCKTCECYIVIKQGSNLPANCGHCGGNVEADVRKGNTVNLVEDERAYMLVE